MAESFEPAAANEELAPKKVIISLLEGTLLRDKSFFPYYMLVALEAGGPVRALLLLLLSPIIWLVSRCISEKCAIAIQLFLATAGLKLSAVRAVAVAVLPKFLLDDLEPAAYGAFLMSGRSTTALTRHQHCVVSSHPKVFVEHFLRTYLRVDVILASELQVSKNGTCTGFLAAMESLLGEDRKLQAIELLFGNKPAQTLYGLCVEGQQHGFLSQCQETVVVQRSKNGEKVPKEQYLTPLVFHDGRLVIRPSPLAALMVVLWTPLGFLLAMARLVFGLSLPQELAYPLTSFLGLKLRVRGAPPLPQTGDSQQKGVMFVCVHRTLGDPTFMTMALRRKVRALVFSLSKISEFLTPIGVARLTRNREDDAKLIKKLLEKEDLFVCPEGTTCREPFLLRFSPLFAEIADWVVPVATNVETSIFHGTSARGYKFLDGFFLAMNPRPAYEVTFLEPISTRELRERGNSAIEIANMVQKQLADVLGFGITNYNRKDKYLLLAGHDGSTQWTRSCMA